MRKSTRGRQKPPSSGTGIFSKADHYCWSNASSIAIFNCSALRCSRSVRVSSSSSEICSTALHTMVVYILSQYMYVISSMQTEPCSLCPLRLALEGLRLDFFPLPSSVQLLYRGYYPSAVQMQRLTGSHGAFQLCASAELCGTPTRVLEPIWTW